MSEDVSVLDVLNAVDNAFENKLIGCVDCLSKERQAKVAWLRKLIKRAINQAEIDEAVSSHYEPVFEQYR